MSDCKHCFHQTGMDKPDHMTKTIFEKCCHCGHAQSRDEVTNPYDTSDADSRTFSAGQHGLHNPDTPQFKS